MYDELVKKVNRIQATDTNNFVRKEKDDYTTKIPKIEKKILDYNHDKYITSHEFNKLTAENFKARLAQAKLETKANVADFAKKSKVWSKITSNKTKHVKGRKN